MKGFYLTWRGARMKKRLYLGSQILFSICVAASLYTAGAETMQTPSPGAMLDSLPLAFEPNQGQTNAQVEYFARGRGYTLFALPEEIVLSLAAKTADAPRDVLRIQWEGANPTCASGIDPWPGYVNYYLGSDPAQWRCKAPQYGKIQYKELYPGIDLFFYGAQGELEYDFVVAPHASPDAICLTFAGADHIELMNDGGLRITLKGGVVFQHPPMLYQEVDGQRKYVPGKYIQRGPSSVGVLPETYDPAIPLTIDPILAYSSYMGGLGQDKIGDFCIDTITAGHPRLMVVGATDSLSFPVGSSPQNLGGQDAFLAILDPTLSGPGSLEGCVYFGGWEDDAALGVSISSATGSVITVVGQTGSPDLPRPISGNLGTQLNLGNKPFATDGFVAGFKQDLTLWYSGYLGGSVNDQATAVKSTFNSVYITGSTSSEDFPLAGNTVYPVLKSGAQSDVFVTRIAVSSTWAPTAPPPSLNYSTYFGAINAVAQDLVLAGTDILLVSGWTQAGYPLEGAPVQANFGGGETDAFLSCLDISLLSGNPMYYSSYIGGSGDDAAYAIATNAPSTFSSGAFAWIGGRTTSPTLPGTLARAPHALPDGFITKIDISGPAPGASYSAYLGGDGVDTVWDIAPPLITNSVAATGETNSTPASFGLTGEYLYAGIQDQLNPGQPGSNATDAFLVKLDETNGPLDASFLHWATYLGGAGGDVGQKLIYSAPYDFYIAGWTESQNYPTAGSIQNGLRGTRDGFVTHIALNNKVIYVDVDSVAPALLGTSWENAFHTLTEALAVALSGDEIWVAEGTYNGHVSMVAGVSLYGGFEGVENTRDPRDPVQHPTIINGGNAIGLGPVLVGAANTRLDGFVVQGGNTNSGAGLLISSTSMIVKNCQFLDNIAAEYGGGISCENSTAKILNCVFIHNQASQGGAINLTASIAAVTNCTFSTNTATIAASGHSMRIQGDGHTVKVTNCILWGRPNADPHIAIAVSPNLSVRYCLVEGGYTGAGAENILSDDPKFALAPTSSNVGDVHLQEDSPARDAGTPDARFKEEGYVFEDLSSSPRIVMSSGCTYDLGAFETTPALPVITVLGNNPFTVEALTPYTDPGVLVTDGCGGDISGNVIMIPASIDTSTVQTHVVTYQAMDDLGRSAPEATRSIHVVDTTSPTLTLLGDVTATVECGSGPYVDPGATANDTVDGNITSRIIRTGSVDTAIPKEYTLTYNVSDLNENAAVAMQRTVTVVDTTAPVLTLNGSDTISIQCGSTFTDPGASATDNCAIDLSGQIDVRGAVDEHTPGVYDLEYNVSDPSGNPAAARIRHVSVTDTTRPQLTLIGPQTTTIACGSSYADPGATSMDACDGDLSSQIIVIGEVDPKTPGIYTIKYRSTDTAGNGWQISRTVTVEDRTAPALSLLGSSSITVECGQNFVDPWVIATDACDGDLSGSVQVSGTVNTAEPKTYTLTYSVSDAAGNAAVPVTRRVTVQDTRAPVITLNGTAIVNINLNSVYADAGATALDACAGDISSSIQVNNPVNTAVPSTYLVMYSVQDSAGNFQSKNRTVNVIGVSLVCTVLNAQTSAPIRNATVSLTPPATTPVTSNIEGVYTLLPVPPGSYTVAARAPGYTANSKSINATTGGALAITLPLTPIPVDTTPPVITLIGSNAVVVECGTSYIDDGAQAQDDVDGNISARILTEGRVNATAPGYYILTYSVSDTAGNAATPITRSVRVLDTRAPLILLQGENPFHLDCGADYVEPGVTVSDTCDPVPQLSSDAGTVVDTSVAGSFVITYTATDADQNISTNTRTVIVSGPACPTEGEGQADGEGQAEGATEGATEGALDACEELCSATTDSYDEDGDGLSLCIENCLGTRDDKTDTDSDGIPDGFEAVHGLDPLRIDAEEDPDADAVSNLEEFLGNSDPRDANDPEWSYYIAPNGSNALIGGTREHPWQTINFALSHVSTSASHRSRFILAPGVYIEDLSLHPDMTIVGSTPNTARIDGAITGAMNAALVDLILTVPAGKETIVTMDQIIMQLSGVVFQGPPDRSVTAIAVTGSEPYDSLIESCTFSRLDIGIDIWDSIPIIRRCLFEDIATAAIYLHDNTPSTAPSRSLGDATDPNSGWNRFNLTPPEDGRAIINERNLSVPAQHNDWGTDNPDEITDLIQGTADFQYFLSAGSGLLAASLYCTLWDAASQERVRNATVSLTPSVFAPVTVNQNGVYGFPSLTQGSYTVTIQAQNFAGAARAVSLASGQVLSISVPLNKTTPEGEGQEDGEGQLEGEGEGEGETWCGCPKSASGAFPTGDAFVTGLALLALLTSAGLTRWKP